MVTPIRILDVINFWLNCDLTIGVPGIINSLSDSLSACILKIKYVKFIRREVKMQIL